MLKAKHLLHPLRTASIARQLLAMRVNLFLQARRGRRRYKGDSRYLLHNVTAGFASRIPDRSDDTSLLDRICSAYIKSMEQQRLAPPAYQATNWWEQVRRES